MLREVKNSWKTHPSVWEVEISFTGDRMNLLCDVCNCLKVGDHLHWHCTTTQKIKYVITRNKTWTLVNSTNKSRTPCLQLKYVTNAKSLWQDKYPDKGYTLLAAHRVKQRCPSEDIHVPLSDGCKNNSTAVQLIRQRPTALSLLACRELEESELKTN